MTDCVRQRAILHGTAFLSLAELVEELVESDYYRELNEKLNDLTERVREIRSVTVGVNLDAQLPPQGSRSAFHQPASLQIR